MSGVPYLGLFSLTWMKFMRDQLKRHLLCKAALHLLSPHALSFFPPLYFKRPWSWNDSQAFPQAIPVVKILKYCHVIWQISAAPKAPRAPLFHQPKALPTCSSTKGLLPGMGEEVLRAPSPMVWHPSRLVTPSSSSFYICWTSHWFPFRLFLIHLHYSREKKRR